MRVDISRTRALLVLLVGLVLIGSALHAGTGPRSPADAREAVAPTEVVVRPAAAAPAVRAPGRDGRPNIVLITTDDETVSDMRWMPRTMRYLADQGVTFSRALSPHPLCCPARAAILTGQYAQNNGVKSNKEPFNFAALQTHTTLPVWLHQAGYRTGFTGKYLNGYGRHGAPQPGWDYWDPTMVNPYSYVGYEMYRDGRQKRYRTLNNVDYVNRRTRSLVTSFSRGDKPFFIWASHVAPHGRITPGRRHGRSSVSALPPTRFAHLFANVQSPSLRDPAYGDDDVTDQNSFVQGRNRPPAGKINTIFRSRIQALQGVDEGIVDLVNTLKRTGELANTYIFFTSDNGFLLGEHNLLTKNVPYRQSLRVPLIVRGPGVPKGVVRSQRSLMIDLAPTFADLADAAPLVTVDGVSLMPAIRDDEPLRETVLIQAGPVVPEDRPYGWWWRGVATDRFTYARFYADGIEELYDHQYDPSEIDNVATDPAYADVLAELRRRTDLLVTCRSGAECSQDFDELPGPTGPPSPN